MTGASLRAAFLVLWAAPRPGQFSRSQPGIHSTGDPDRGYQQLMTEQMPIRKQQLYETYGLQGPIPLIPGQGGAGTCV